MPVTASTSEHHRPGVQERHAPDHPLQQPQRRLRVQRHRAVAQEVPQAARSRAILVFEAVAEKNYCVHIQKREKGSELRGLIRNFPSGSWHFWRAVGVRLSTRALALQNVLQQYVCMLMYMWAHKDKIV